MEANDRRGTIELTWGQADVIWRALNVLQHRAERAVADIETPEAERALAINDIAVAPEIAMELTSSLSMSVRLYSVDDLYPYGQP